MQLPPQLRYAIESETAQCNQQSLSQAATELSEKYRAQRPLKGKFITSEIHRLAYITTRFPATFAATHSVFTEIQRLMPDHPITSLLDLGAGPGTASWAATQVFPDLQQITLIEQDEGLIQLGKSLALTGENTLLQNATWARANLRTINTFPAHDLVISSYALGELPQNVSGEILKTAWSSANTTLAIIEPGTMVGFNRIRQFRDDLLELGGHLIAPCPHQNECPIGVDDWCHFSQRVDRSSLHRRLKTGTLGHEDEKFSYIAASKDPIQPASARVLRHPKRRSGHAQLQLCTQDGIQTITVSRREKNNWKRARRIDWGDAWH